MTPICLDLYTLPKPTVAAMTGHAIAGGCILALCCDYRFIAKGRKLMGLNEIKLGAPVPYLADCVLRQTIGVRLAREMMDAGEFYPSDELFQMGVVDQVLPLEQVLPKSIKKAGSVGALALWLVGDPDTRMDYLWDLITDEDVWSRRLALVPLTRINRGKMGITFPDLTLQLVDQIKEERHPMITKAVSWVLRETTKTHRDRVAAYLEENRDALASHVVREVDNKLRTGLKSGKG